MTVILKSLSSCLDKHLSRQELSSKASIWIAYSGGLDSTVLLHSAAAYARQAQTDIKAIHINHNLSPNAQCWQQHCLSLCNELGIEIVVKSVQLQDQGLGLEASARLARYAAIAEEVTPQELVLVGQHQNDQVETFFLQLLRGAGPAGLSGMAEYSVNEFGTQLLRPFLTFSREQLHQYAMKNGWRWIEDESNQNNDFDRNYLRNDIIPALKTRWQSGHIAITRSISHIQEQQQLINECVAEKLEPLLVADQQIDIAGLTSHSYTWQKHIIKYWIAQKGAQQPSEKVLARILQDCISARDDAQPKVTWGTWQCCRFAANLYLLPQRQDLHGVVIPYQLGQTLELPENTGQYRVVSADSDNKDGSTLFVRPDAALEIRFGGFTQRFKPAGEKHSKPLNQWFKQWQIPPWERVRTPLLFADGELVAVGERVNYTSLDDNCSRESMRIKWLKY